VRATAEAAFPAGGDSPAFTTPNRLGTVPTGAPIRSTFIPAKSYASYLDIDVRPDRRVQPHDLSMAGGSRSHLQVVSSAALP
jgi:hypothetical protein